MIIKRTLIGAAAVASASALMFTGVAQAAPVVNMVPTADYLVCGNVSTGGSAWTETGAPTGTAVQGAQVTGYLSSGGLTKTTTTDANGGYCIEGDASLVSGITGGGYVTLTVTDLSGTLNPVTGLPYTSTLGFNPWKGGPILKSTQIKTTTFLQHKVSGLDSANEFHFKVS
ncbi:carboxypeptidase-like regulatory domain-containing protein [Rhodococcus sp. ARC_M6]|uniref:carboxypeptidase-like regulatory domain-containing protein n=1 Tax=Rhodococcus sp. ARC_M6 TaxID=2928852 RepID=UPI001FB34386|nr:carboxypeptidase-like regulatory domain-containing protein [Rhodococcus sp. ARC_M6]MCJ0907418.1 carboxypeptidase-like regulatory domain-containing protein [Rhodococcus sp. ARC_M6]